MKSRTFHWCRLDDYYGTALGVAVALILVNWWSDGVLWLTALDAATFTGTVLDAITSALT